MDRNISVCTEWVDKQEVQFIPYVQIRVIVRWRKTSLFCSVLFVLLYQRAILSER